MASIKMSAEEKKWRAEDDARALRRAQEIQSDPNRVKEAHKVIQGQINDLTKVSSAIKGVNKPKNSKSAPKKQTKSAPKKQSKSKK